MANESRVYTNGIGGLIDTQVDTTAGGSFLLSSPALASMPLIDPNHHMMLALDPYGSRGAPEYVRVTAHNPATTIAAPINSAFSTSTTGGSLAASTYYYRVTALVGLAETLPSTETSIATSGSTSTVTVNWGAVGGATGYRVYGRTTGAELLIASVGAVTSFIDTGSVTPSGAMPVTSTAISTICTITAAQEGSLGRVHYADEIWSHAVVASDLWRNPNPDNTYDFNAIYGADALSGGLYDYEFDALNTTGLPAGYSWVNQGVATYQEYLGAGVISSPGQTGDQLTGFARVLPTPSAFTVYAKMQLAGYARNFQHCGLFIYDTVSGKATSWGISYSNGYGVEAGVQWPTLTGGISTVNNTLGLNSISPLYLRLKMNNVASWDLSFSLDGRAWSVVALGFNPGYTPNRIGVMSDVNGAGAVMSVSYEWLRFR